MRVTVPAPPDALSPAQPVTQRRRVGRRWLVNALNHVNFQNGQVLFSFRNQADGATLAVPARPSPSIDHHLNCRWVRTPPVAGEAKGWEFLNFHLSDGLSWFEIPSDDAAWDERGISLTLPDEAYDVNARRSARHASRGVGARVTRGEQTVAGRLLDSSADSFAIRLAAGAPDISVGETLGVTLVSGSVTVFDSPCRVLRCSGHRGGQRIVLRPDAPEGARSARTKYRCLRPRLSPLPLIVFRHPLTGRQVTLRALDISGAGFSVEEEASRAQLLPGLLLPRVSIEVASGFEFPCAARVLYHEPTAEGGMRSGLVVESMSLRDHTRLTALLHLGEYRNTTVCTPHVDPEELWKFFFETGFIYPEKYAHIQDQKAHFLRLYRRLYNRTPQIARHIIYQERGAIRGHVSMFRWYPTTWILHHHAALTSPRHKAGLVVMEQMLRYINEFHRLFPRIMRYIACYYRPNNRFASRTFGDAARSLGDPRRASLDEIAYSHIPEGRQPGPLPSGWTLSEAFAADRAALRDSYDRTGGGLLIEGLALREEDLGDEAVLSREYTRLGFKRNRLLLALRLDGRCAALIAVNISDVGLNLSDLTNGLQVFVVDPQGLPPQVLFDALATLAGQFSAGTTTVLIHPRIYADANGIAYDKAYTLGVLDLHHLAPYLSFIEGLIAPETRCPPGSTEPCS